MSKQRAAHREERRRNTTRRIERDAGPIEILVLTSDPELKAKAIGFVFEGEVSQIIIARVEARAGEVMLLEGDQDELDALLDSPLMIHVGELPAYGAALEVDREGDGPVFWIDGRIDGAGWIDALPDFLRGAHVRARRQLRRRGGPAHDFGGRGRT